MPINRQATIERNIAADEGRIRRGSLASGAVGHALLARYITPLADHLDGVMAKRPPAYKREVKSLTQEIFDALQGVRTDAMAARMLRGCINANDIRGQDCPPDVFEALGAELQEEAGGAAVKRELERVLGKPEAAKAFAQITKQFERTPSAWKQQRAELAFLRKYDIKIASWSHELQARVGNFAADMLLSAPGLKNVIATDKWGMPRMSKEAAEAVNIDLMARPAYEPSGTPPHPWVGFDGLDGDTFVVNCRDEEAVRAAIHSGIPHVDGVNFLRSIPFRTNEHVLAVVKRRELLRKVKDDDDAAQTLLEQNIEQAELYRGRPFYVPLRVDHRGRLIVGPTYNYTGPDHIRGMFQFARSERIGKDGIRWLKIACATSYDQDKLIAKKRFDERLEWTEENIEHICAAGREPLKHIDWLARAAEPIQCVALFNELAKARDNPDYRCSVPIGFDAACSGLQNFALLSRDRDMALRTGLISEEPRDIYDFILHFVRLFLVSKSNVAPLAEWWLDGTPPRLDRKIIKKLVMTYGYSAKEWGQKSGLYKELRKRGEDIPDRAPLFLVKIVRGAIETHMPAAKALMEKLQALVTADTPVSWITPSGLPVFNSYKKADVKEVRLYRLGKLHRHMISVGWKPQQRLGKARSAIAPNYVHSMDAAHLTLVANACARAGIDLVTVHDSFAVLPCHAGRLREILLEQLREMYAGYEPLVPPTGDLDLNEVTGEHAFN
jgi:DNA-directed RNA polymerase